MNLNAHHIPAAAFTALAEGRSSADTVRRLVAAQLSKHILLLRGVRDTARATVHPDTERVEEAYRLLAELQDTHPAEVEAVLRHPPVGAWAKRTIQAMSEGEAGATPSQLAGLAAAAAIRAGAACTIEVPAVDGLVTLPSVGQASGFTGTEHVTLRSRPGHAEVSGGGRTVAIPGRPEADAPGWHGLRRLTTAAHGAGEGILIEDLDPFRMPGTTNMGTRLTASEAAEWQRPLDGAWQILAEHHAEAAAETALAIRAFTPLNPPPSGQVSASSRETFGCIAMSEPRDALTLAVTLVHELHHNKLSAVLDLVRLLYPDDRRFYAPWRDDPRPLSGLLQGAYAHMAIAGFWHRMCQVEEGDALVQPQAEFTRWREATHLVVRTLTSSGRLTPDGEVYLAGMNRTLTQWADYPVRDAATQTAREAAEEHLAAWQARNGTALVG
jgi:uncharacterized protein